MIRSVFLSTILYYFKIFINSLIFRVWVFKTDWGFVFIQKNIHLVQNITLKNQKECKKPIDIRKILK